jgi:hypothetical protein
MGLLNYRDIDTMVLACKYRDVPNSRTHPIHLPIHDLPAAAYYSPLINILCVYVINLTFKDAFSKVTRCDVRDLDLWSNQFLTRDSDASELTVLADSSFRSETENVARACCVCTGTRLALRTDMTVGKPFNTPSGAE